MCTCRSNCAVRSQSRYNGVRSCECSRCSVPSPPPSSSSTSYSSSYSPPPPASYSGSSSRNDQRAVLAGMGAVGFVVGAIVLCFPCIVFGCGELTDWMPLRAGHEATAHCARRATLPAGNCRCVARSRAAWPLRARQPSRCASRSARRRSRRSRRVARGQFVSSCLSSRYDVCPSCFLAPH